MIRSDEAFAEWRDEGKAVPLLQVANKFGAKLKRAGAEWIGPCVYCSGRDRFSINVGKNKWFCRGHGGGADAVSLAMHLGNLSFKSAIEELTGRPCPSGYTKPLTEEEMAARNRKRLVQEDIQQKREQQEAQYQESTTAAAQVIWDASTAITGTLAQTYLLNRGIPAFETDVLRFHPALPYPGKLKRYPALICRVDGMDGSLCAIWRIFLRDDGRKADVSNCKLGLGPAGGGAVRIGGIGPKVAVAEGLESALGFWFLTGRKYPVLAALSTSGMIGIELPLGVDHCVIVPDGDRPIRKKGDEYEPAVPAGRKAAQALRSRLLAEGIAVTIAAEPNQGQDYCDLWAIHAREVA